jgi:hypothetical protein
VPDYLVIVADTQERDKLLKSIKGHDRLRLQVYHPDDQTLRQFTFKGGRDCNVLFKRNVLTLHSFIRMSEYSKTVAREKREEIADILLRLGATKIETKVFEKSVTSSGAGIMLGFLSFLTFGLSGSREYLSSDSGEALVKRDPIQTITFDESRRRVYYPHDTFWQGIVAARLQERGKMEVIQKVNVVSASDYSAEVEAVVKNCGIRVYGSDAEKREISVAWHVVFD